LLGGEISLDQLRILSNISGEKVGRRTGEVFSVLSLEGVVIVRSLIVEIVIEVFEILVENISLGLGIHFVVIVVIILPGLLIITNITTLQALPVFLGLAQKV